MSDFLCLLEPNPFHEACNGNIAEVLRLIGDYDVNEPDEYGSLPIRNAVTSNSIRIVELLLERGADIESPDDEGSTILWYACSFGHEEIAALLIKWGADVNRANDMSWTPLMLTVRNGNLGMITLLLDNGADLYHSCSRWSSLIGVAIIFKIDVSIARYLIERGLDVNHGGRSHLPSACCRGLVDYVDLLLEHGVDVNDGDGDPILIYCCSGDLELAKYMIAFGADVNPVVESINKHPLSIGCIRNNEGFVKLILENWPGGYIDTLEEIMNLSRSWVGNCHRIIRKFIIEEKERTGRN